MREIKFRAWDKRLEEMVDLGTHIQDYIEFPPFSPNRLEFDLIFMQYTGLKDKNGVEIYEGDWLIDGNDSSNGGSEVFYRYGQWQPFSYVGSYSGEDYEVIGNIYENKELLNV